MKPRALLIWVGIVAGSAMIGFGLASVFLSSFLAIRPFPELATGGATLLAAMALVAGSDSNGRPRRRR